MAKLYEGNAVKLKEQNDVRLWQERISVAKKELEQWEQDSGAKRFLKEYEGDYGLVTYNRNRPIKIPPINEVLAFTQADIAATLSRDPYIEVNAEAGTVKGAAFWEVILNYYWRHLKTKEEVEFEIIDKDLVGFGWHKVGQTSDGKLYSSYIRYKDVLFNIGSKRPPNDSLWMAHRLIKPLSEVKKRFPNAKGLQGSTTTEIGDDILKNVSYKDDIKVCVLWEIWDLQNRQILLIAEELKDKYLDNPKPWPDYQVTFPFDMYWDLPIPNKPRAMSAISPWEPQLLEEITLMAQAVNHGKRWNRQAFVKNGSIDENALDKYERGDDGAIIQYNGDSADIKFADFGPLPTDFYLLMDRLKATRQSISGQPEFARGGVTKTNTRTIGELNLMSEGNKGLQGRKIDRLETHCENIARKMMAVLKANFDFEESVKITGDTPDEIIQILQDHYDPTTKTIKFTPQDIAGEYDVSIKAGSTLPMDKASKMQTLEIVGQVLAQVAATGISTNLVAAWLEEMLDGFNIKSLKEAFEKDLIAQEQQKQQEAQQQKPDEMKTLMEAAKREAQVHQIVADTKIAEQEADLGPQGRTMMDILKKSANGKSEK